MDSGINGSVAQALNAIALHFANCATELAQREKEVENSRLVSLRPARYVRLGFGRVEDRSRREPGEESPNTTGRDAAQP